MEPGSVKIVGLAGFAVFAPDGTRLPVAGTAQRVLEVLVLEEGAARSAEQVRRRAGLASPDTVGQLVSRLRAAWAAHPAIGDAAREILPEARGASGYRLVLPRDAVDVWRFEDALRAGRPRPSDGAGAEVWNAYLDAMARAEAVWRDSEETARAHPEGRHLGPRDFETRRAVLRSQRAAARDDWAATLLRMGRADEALIRLEGWTGPSGDAAGDDLLWARRLEAVATSGTDPDRLAAAWQERLATGVEPSEELARAHETLRWRMAAAAPSGGEPDVADDAEREDATSREPPQLQRRAATLAVFLLAVPATLDDPEHAYLELEPRRARIEEAVLSAGGVLRSSSGQRVEAWFGLVRAREDDALRAVTAALGCACDIGQCTVLLESDDVLVDATGAPVGTTTALDAIDRLAQPVRHRPVPSGSVVVGPGTFALTAGRVTYGSLPTLRDGKRATPRWRAETVVPAGALEQRARSSFVGRREELGLLEMAIDRAHRDGAAHLLTILGEAGVGKSRLVEELSRRVGDTTRWLRGRCLSFGDKVTFSALADVVREWLGLVPGQDAAVAAGKLDAGLHRAGVAQRDRSWIRSWLVPLLGLPGSDRESGAPDEASAAWAMFLEAVASAEPCVIVFEDLQWADDTFLDFLSGLLVRPGRRGPTVMCTARPDLLERRPTWGAGSRNVTLLTLPTLGHEQVRAIVEEFGQRDEGPAIDPEAIAERSGGNPFFAEELVRMLSEPDSAALGRRRGGPVVPATVRAVVAARLDSLPPVAFQVALDAAVVGRTFWPGALRAASGLSAGAIREAVDELERKELVRRAGASTIDGEHEYVFWHAIVRDVAYDQGARSRSAPRHESVARWIEDVLGDRVADQAELLAHHYVSAVQLGTLPGREPPRSLIDSARDALILAAQRMRSVDLLRAREHLRQALDYAGDKRVTVLLMLAPAERETLQLERARAHASELHRLGVDGAGPRVEALGLIEMSRTLFSMGALDEAGEMALAARQRAQSAAQDILLHANIRVAAVLASRGNATPAIRLLDQDPAETDPVTTDEGFKYYASSVREYCRACAGDVATALRRLRSLHREPDLADHPVEYFRLSNNLAVIESVSGGADPARSVIAEAKQRLTERVSSITTGTLLETETELLFRVGAYEESARLATSILSTQSVPISLKSLGLVRSTSLLGLVRSGDLDDALILAEDLEQSLDVLAFTDYRIPVMTAITTAYLSTRQPKALSSLHRAVNYLSQDDDRSLGYTSFARFTLAVATQRLGLTSQLATIIRTAPIPASPLSQAIYELCTTMLVSPGASTRRHKRGDALQRLTKLGYSSEVDRLLTWAVSLDS